MSDIRIQDDLYEFVNHDWLETAVIPGDRPTAGGFAELDIGVEKRLMEDFREMSEKGEFPDSYMERAIKVYRAALDVKGRNRAGIRPVMKEANKILKMKDINAFNRNLKELVLSGAPLPFVLDVDVNMKNADEHYISIGGPSTILPDTTYYKEEMKPQHDAILGIWTNMVQAILAKTGLSEEEQKLFIDDALKFDAIIASMVKSSEEWSEYTNVYNPTKTRTVASLLKPIKFRKLLTDLFGEAKETINITEPRWLKNFKSLFNADTFELYKHWAYIKTILGACSYLSEDLRALGSSYRMALSGIAEVTKVEKFAYQLSSSVFSEPVGLYYGRKYFGEEAKKDITAMVYDIIDMYKVRIDDNPILSESTKEKAKLKLSTMVVKMGYPDKVNELYDKMVFEDGLSLYEIMTKLGRIRREDSLSKLNKPVDRTIWAMPGHMVNACYNPFSNDITFPAAILQPPFYSIAQTRSQNLGGIGAVIGHEISHAFDNNGAKFDEKGNLENWWTKEDNKKFVACTKAMIREFDGYELPWGKVNGKLVVSENIADNGGMAVTLNIMNKLESANYEEYFINWAKVWCMKAKPEYQQLLLSVDVHAPAVLRANMQPRNFPEWYETFGVTKKDGMFLAPNKRVVIW